MFHRLLLLLSSALLLAACAVTTHVIQLTPAGKYAPVDYMHVQVFLNETDVKVPFEKIALIEAEGQYDQVDDEKMVTAMKKQAGRLGANAIILGEFKDPSVVAKVAQAVLDVSAQRKARVVAIRLRSEATS